MARSWSTQEVERAIKAVADSAEGMIPLMPVFGPDGALKILQDLLDERDALKRELRGGR